MLVDSAENLSILPTFESPIEKCARCGRNHRKILYKKFKQAVQAEQTDTLYPTAPYTHWGLCPRTKEPILMRFEEEKYPVSTSFFKTRRDYEEMKSDWRKSGKCKIKSTHE